jgi:hypothetical protein
MESIAYFCTELLIILLTISLCIFILIAMACFFMGVFEIYYDEFIRNKIRNNKA